MHAVEDRGFRPNLKVVVARFDSAAGEFGGGFLVDADDFGSTARVGAGEFGVGENTLAIDQERVLATEETADFLHRREHCGTVFRGGEVGVEFVAKCREVEGCAGCRCHVFSFSNESMAVAATAGYFISFHGRNGPRGR